MKTGECDARVKMPIFFKTQATWGVARLHSSCSSGNCNRRSGAFTGPNTGHFLRYRKRRDTPLNEKCSGDYSSLIALIINVIEGECPEEDSNLHSLRNQILSLARLPISPSGHWGEWVAIFVCGAGYSDWRLGAMPHGSIDEKIHLASYFWRRMTQARSPAGLSITRVAPALFRAETRPEALSGKAFLLM